jgi:hypothetical protein
MKWSFLMNAHSRPDPRGIVHYVVRAPPSSQSQTRHTNHPLTHSLEIPPTRLLRPSRHTSRSSSPPSVYDNAIRYNRPGSSSLKSKANELEAGIEAEMTKKHEL